MGIGIRKNGDFALNEEDKKFKIIDRPQDCSGVYLKEAVGKFCNLLLTRENELLFNGKNKYCVAGSPDVNAFMDKFYDITSNFPLESDEKIIDIDVGKFIVAVTNKGNLYATGT